MKKIFVISGATASGKSSLAIKFAKHKNISIINADSLQIYRDLPILSAQPPKEETSEVKHYLYSYLDYDQSSSVADWLKEVKKATKDSLESDLIPVIVGGTGMYISKLINGINKIPEISQEVKNSSIKIFENQGKDGLIQEMLKFNINEDEIKYTDPQRLMRQYQVLAQTNKPISYWYKQTPEYIIDPQKIIHINIEIDRKDLYDKCNKRFDIMIKQGAIEEVEKLISKIGDSNDYQVTKTLGYYEIRDYLNGLISKDEMINLSSQKTRNYAKRQLTWFRHQFTNKKVFDSTSKALEFLKSCG